MIDTICLLIPKEKMTFVSNGTNWDLHSRTDSYKRFVRNPTNADKASGKYYPRLTGYSRNFGQDANVRIELSLPKLLYNNNLDELENTDFKEVVITLKDRLQDMGVIVDAKVIAQASVSAVHFSKNILLQDGYTVNYVITQMNKVNLSTRFDFAKTRFMNDGQSLYAHTKAHQFVIYDKVADLRKSEARAIDKDQSPYQKSLFSSLSTRTDAREILRFEVRLAQKPKMNKIITDLGYEKNPTFKDVFSEELSKKVVMHYWQELIKERSLGIFSVDMTAKEILQSLLLADNTLKSKQAVYLFGLITLAKDENGMRQLRTMLDKHSKSRTWYRMAKDMQDARALLGKDTLRNWVKQIDKVLEDYKVYKIKDYEK